MKRRNAYDEGAEEEINCNIARMPEEAVHDFLLSFYLCHPFSLFGYRHATFRLSWRSTKKHAAKFGKHKNKDTSKEEQSSEAEEDWKTRSLMQRQQRDEVARQPVMAQ